MKATFTPIAGSVLAPQGFQASGVFCNIRRLGTGKGSHKGQKLDLGLLVSEEPATVAGMFTTNQICAAPVKVCLSRVRTGKARAIVVNSGNANACTGERGMRDALAMTRLLAQRMALPEDQVLVASTGRIGALMPMPNVRQGIESAIRSLGNTVAHGEAIAEAILTSDTHPKALAVEMQLNGKTGRIGGVCKGAGMIQPGMSPTGQRPPSRPKTNAQGLHATMLGFLTTDIAIDAKALKLALECAVAESFNCITVDGDMSTNDTVLILANGLAGNPILRMKEMRAAANCGAACPGSAPAQTQAAHLFLSALRHVCRELSKMIVRDGEGVHRVVSVQVSGARSNEEADAAARAVANSALVKTSWHGGDPNWGRIIDALGYSPAKVIEERVDIGYRASGQRRTLWSVRSGRPTATSFAKLCAEVKGPEFQLCIRLNQGKGAATLYASDLTEAYVEFNKGDVSDPGSLGG